MSVEESDQDEYIPEDAQEDGEDFIQEGVATVAKRKRKAASTNESPAKLPNRTVYSCSKCGRTDFLSATGSEYHQGRCDGTRNPKGPWKCSNCGKSDFSTSQAFSGHARCCHPRTITDTSITLTPASLIPNRKQLSDYNFSLTASLELFESSEADVKKQMIGNGKRHIAVGNVGIRCSFCAMNNNMTAGSITYPHQLKFLPHDCYVMAKRHLLGNCKAIPKEIQQRLSSTKKSSVSQSMRTNFIGLPLYFNMIVEAFDLTDDGVSDGIRRRNT
jgi:hypothetical protein